MDFGAVMTIGAARGADAELLAEILPIAERAILAPLSDSASDGDANGQ